MKPDGDEMNKRLILFMATALLILGFQNCSPFRVDPSAMGQPLSFASTGGADLQPATDKLDPTCMSNPDYDACLFKKNPVAQKGALLSNTSLDSLQYYGVKITGVDTSGTLSNGTVRIETVRGTPVSTFTTSLRFRAENDGTQKFAQVMTYYWLTRATEYIEARTGTFPARDKNIRVVVDDSVAGWSPKTNSIHLKLDDNGASMALNSDLAIHFLGAANLYYATNGAITSLASGTHRDCGLKTNGCCASQIGCARAIESGVGDYFAAMIFPDQPTVGETWAGSVNGLGFCSQSRDLRTAGGLSAQTAYNACGAAGAGEVTTMGTVYASIWWEVRKAAGENGARDIDTIFMQHLALLNGGDTFQTAKAKIRSVDARLFNGKYSASFDAQFASRGL